MKRKLIGMAIAAGAMLSACQTLENPTEFDAPVHDNATIFTADLGPQTKTYLDFDAESGVYKTKWADGDGIIILASQSDGSFKGAYGYLVDGIGTTSGKFASNISGEHYLAFYGYRSNASNLANGEIVPFFLEEQHSRQSADSTGVMTVEKSFSDYAFPMYAESDSTVFQFKNLGGILKMSLTGTDYISSIYITSNSGVKMSGGSRIIMNDNGGFTTEMVDSLSSDFVRYVLNAKLSETEATDCYIVLPPQTYTGGITIKINSVSGQMIKTISSDFTLERSQIRAIPAFEYKNEETYSWAVIGSMSNWSEDIPMEFADNVYKLNGINLTEGDEFKFRANGDWAFNLGGMYAPTPIGTDDTQTVIADGGNFQVTTTGTYDIELDPVNGLASFICKDSYVECEDYDSVASLSNNTKVSVTGFVLATYKRGFILNIGNYWGNTILVYQGTDQSMYKPVIGNQVTVLCEKIMYNGLPELTNISSITVIDAGERNYMYGQYIDLTSSADFDSFYWDRYDYVKFIGTLEYTGSYWNVNVDGATTHVGSIMFPDQDLTAFIGKKVFVGGWFCGFSGGKYLNIVLREISEASTDGSTEDVTPGDDLLPDDSTK